MRHRAFPILAVSVALAAPALSQNRGAAGRWVGSPSEEYVRLLQLTGVVPMSSLMIRPTEYATAWDAPDSAQWRAPWRRYNDAAFVTDSINGISTTLYRPYTHVTFNSAFAWGMNDGALWSGKGLSAAQTAGAGAEWGPLRVDFVPTFTWSQNSAFTLAPHRVVEPNTTPLADEYAGQAFDRPQRFGYESFSRVDPGQSGITVQDYGVRAGFSARNMWWGPGTENALIITNQAAGFNHAFAGTQRPVRTRIGTFEALWAVGSLQESGYWRTAADTFPSQRWLNGLTLVYEPRWLPGLYLGATRLFYAYNKRNPITPGEVLGVMFQPFRKRALADTAGGNPDGNDARDQMAALSFRWLVPGIGFEAYGEWGRNDHSWDLRDLFIQPDHSRAWLLGAARIFKLREGVLAARMEAIDLARTTTQLSRPTPVWYAHHIVQQGFTQRGQIVGAGIGPGSNQQTASLDWFRPDGRVGFIAQRQLHNIDGFYRSGRRERSEQNASLLAGPRATLFAGAFEIHAQYALILDLNRYAIHRNDARNHRLDLRVQSGF